VAQTNAQQIRVIPLDNRIARFPSVTVPLSGFGPASHGRVAKVNRKNSIHLKTLGGFATFLGKIDRVSKGLVPEPEPVRVLQFASELALLRRMGWN
jgi:hypothetical protein